jgi:hypothetical protein
MQEWPKIKVDRGYLGRKRNHDQPRSSIAFVPPCVSNNLARMWLHFGPQNREIRFPGENCYGEGLLVCLVVVRLARDGGGSGFTG